VGLLERVRDRIAMLEEKALYRYSTIFLGGIILLLGLLLFYHYRSISSLQKKIADINRMRRRDVQAILSKADYISKQQQDIDALLAEDKNFKIVGYFKEVLDKLKLAEKKVIETPSQIEQEQYRESILDVSFDDMDMKQVTELLKELEENRRIFIKKLDILRSKKVPNKLEVNMTIGTFLLKSD